MLPRTGAGRGYRDYHGTDSRQARAQALAGRHGRRHETRFGDRGFGCEKGGNCDLTKPDERVVSDNGVVVIGYTDFPSRMATQASLLYATNIRHMLTDLTPEKDGVIHHNMEDDVIRGATVTHQGRSPSHRRRRR